jgi:very-short-patch-repair endonuclease
MLPYNRQLKKNTRTLRNSMTDAEQRLWSRLRRKQINGWQFYRQKPIGPYIVDFYCSAARLVVELDGSQHLDPRHQSADQRRKAFLEKLGLRVLRFDNRQVLLETDAVIEVIAEIPPVPPLSKGGVKRLPTKSPPLVNESIPPLCKRGARGDFPSNSDG